MPENKKQDKKKSHWFISRIPAYYAMIAIAFFFFGTLFAGFSSSNVTGNIVASNAVPKDKAGSDVINYINTYLLKNGFKASLDSISDEGWVYQMNLSISGPQGKNTYTSYVTKDGKLLFVSAIDLTYKPKKPQNQAEPTEIPKREKPDVKLFVMSYCPYGLQAEKAFLPVYKLLKDKADMTVNFVSYAMHGKKELDENLRQYCIQLEQGDKYYDYLSCFAGGSGNYSKCLEEAKIDKTKLNSCMERVDKEYNITEMYNDRSTWASGRFPLFNVEADLNTKYGVRGSPTLVINDKVVSINRSPEAYKEAICSAFTSPPEECKQNLSESAASPGFGGGVGSSSGGSCG